MEHRIKDGDVVRLADLLGWYEKKTLRQAQSADRIWITVHFTKPKAEPKKHEDANSLEDRL